MCELVIQQVISVAIRQGYISIAVHFDGLSDTQNVSLGMSDFDFRERVAPAGFMTDHGISRQVC